MTNTTQFNEPRTVKRPGTNFRGATKRFTFVRPFLPKRCPLPPSVRVPVTSANRGLLRLLRNAELEAFVSLEA